MLGWRSSGLSPAPSAGACASVVNGVAANTSSPVKKAQKPSSTAVAYGVTSRSRRRVKRSTRLDHIDSSHTQSRSEPSCEDHTAAALYRPGVVVDECSATVAKLKSERRNASSRIPKASVSTPATANTARRAESPHSRRPGRAPYTPAAMPYTATARARIRQARPTMAIRRLGSGLGGELGRALGDQRVPLADEHGALLADGHDDLAAIAKRVRHGTHVADRNRGGALAVAHAEQDRVAL